MTTDPLLRFRGEFSILEKTTSPHFDTTDAELETAFEVIDKIWPSSAWERWRGRPVLVT